MIWRRRFVLPSWTWIKTTSVPCTRYGMFSIHEGVNCCWCEQYVCLWLPAVVEKVEAMWVGSRKQISSKRQAFVDYIHQGLFTRMTTCTKIEFLSTYFYTLQIKITISWSKFHVQHGFCCHFSACILLFLWHVISHSSPEQIVHQVPLIFSLPSCINSSEMLIEMQVTFRAILLSLPHILCVFNESPKGSSRQRWSNQDAQRAGGAVYKRNGAAYPVDGRSEDIYSERSRWVQYLYA